MVPSPLSAGRRSKLYARLNGPSFAVAGLLQWYAGVIRTWHSRVLQYLCCANLRGKKAEQRQLLRHQDEWTFQVHMRTLQSTFLDHSSIMELSHKRDLLRRLQRDEFLALFGLRRGIELNPS